MNNCNDIKRSITSRAVPPDLLNEDEESIFTKKNSQKSPSTFANTELSYNQISLFETHKQQIYLKINYIRSLRITEKVAGFKDIDEKQKLIEDFEFNSNQIVNLLNGMTFHVKSIQETTIKDNQKDLYQLVDILYAGIKEIELIHNSLYQQSQIQFLNRVIDLRGENLIKPQLISIRIRDWAQELINHIFKLKYQKQIQQKMVSEKGVSLCKRFSDCLFAKNRRRVSHF